MNLLNIIRETATGAMEDIPDYGDLIPLSEWLENVKFGAFIDYDGHGNLATETQCSDIVIIPSEVEGYVFPEWTTHIVWYNR